MEDGVGRREQTKPHDNRGTYLPGLRKARHLIGMTQREVAERAGVSQHSVNKLENLQRKGYAKTVRRIANALKTEIANLIEE